MDLEETLTIQDVARLLKVTTKTVRRWVEVGEFPQPFWLTHKEQRWTYGDYVAFVNRKKREPRPEEPPKKGKNTP